MRILILHVFLLGSKIASSQDIFEAVRTGNISRVEALMKENKDTINSVNENGFTPLIIATYRNQLAIVEYLINNNVDINYISQEGSALLGACYKGNTELTKLLLENGADVNTVSPQKTSALIFAVQSRNIKLLELLLDYNADRSIVDINGFTALDYAKKLNNSKIIKLLENE